MEPPSGFWASLWSLLKFIPFFCGLLLLGVIKGALVCPWPTLIMFIGNSAIILGLWPAHAVWTYYCIIRTKQAGPVLKLLACLAVTVPLLLWPVVGVAGSLLAGAVYGFLRPVMATFDAVGEGKEDPFIHCIVDGTWSAVLGSCTVVRDLKDMLFHTYFSVMDELRLQSPSSGKPYEIRLVDIPGAALAGLFGIILDIPMVSLIAIYKCPIMLFKGWKRLIEDLVGREGPFLEAACVPFAGFAILLWPLAVVGSLIASVLSSVPLGAYASVVAYQESSLLLGLRYAVSSLAIFDEYTNDTLDLRPGSCFPRYQYRKNENPSVSVMSKASSFNKKQEERNAPSRSTSFKNSFEELNPFKMLDDLFAECKRHGEALVAEGVITQKDIDETKTGKVGSGVLNVGLPAYALLAELLRGAKADYDGLMLDGSNVMSENKPKSTLYDWFFEPLMIIREQLRAEKLSEEEEDYLRRTVLLFSDPERRQRSLPRLPSLTERKRAEIEAFARRLQGITKSISRFPTSKRRFDALVKSLSEELERKMGGGGGSSHGGRSGASQLQRRWSSGIARMLSQNSAAGQSSSVRNGHSGGGGDIESQDSNENAAV